MRVSCQWSDYMTFPLTVIKLSVIRLHDISHESKLSVIRLHDISHESKLSVIRLHDISYESDLSVIRLHDISHESKLLVIRSFPIEISCVLSDYDTFLSIYGLWLPHKKENVCSRISLFYDVLIKGNNDFLYTHCHLPKKRKEWNVLDPHKTMNM